MKTTKHSRRNALQIGLTALGGMLLVPTASAASSCQLTPDQAKGPFYPIKDQLDKDGDLTSVRNLAGQALGKIILVEGLVSDQHCKPVQGVLVEIWQACASGKYDHPGDPNPAQLDPNFQYWGKALTDATGFYRFKTILPGAYPANSTWRRPPHIHFKIQKLGYRELITQLYFEGDPLNDKDLILQDLTPAERKNVVVPLVPGEGPVPTAQFNIGIVSVV